ncbi:MAG: high-potential iron-sulfur protein [Pseudoxanthomonas sp.]
MNEFTVSRRKFLIGAAVAAVATPMLMAAPQARAAALPKLPLTNPQAKALGYVTVATTSTNAAHKAGSDCANCQFYTAATGACALFAGFSVEPKGWCSAWAKKAG